MQKIGFIVHLQIQPESIKVDTDNTSSVRERYDPTRLLAVQEILLTQSGVEGVTRAKEHIIDVHNEKHPRTKSRGYNGFSFGFTSHYKKMRDHFGLHIMDACAGENVIVETAKVFSPADLGNKLAIRKADTGEYTYLTEVKPIAPCVPFSMYAAQKQLSPQETKMTLQFLMNGTRGFLAELVDAEQIASIRVGDELCIY